MEEHIDMKNQDRLKKLPDAISIREGVSKLFAHNKFNDPSLSKNSAHVDFNDKKLDVVRFVKVNSMPVVNE